VVRSAAAEHAIVLGEHEAQLGDAPAQARGLLDQEDFQTGVSQVERGAHAAYTPADHHSRGRL
jgi:hypothetical protein